MLPTNHATSVRRKKKKSTFYRILLIGCAALVFLVFVALVNIIYIVLQAMIDAFGI